MGTPTPPRRLVFPVLLTLFGFIVSGGAGAFFYFLPVIQTAFSATGHNDLPAATQPPAGSSPRAAPGSNDPFTVLLLGSDNDAKFSSTSLLTQSMILVRVIPATKQVTMLSIPRDLYVPINGGGTAKIDTAFAYGGARNAIATVQNAFHVHVDHYVWIGLKGLTALIDAVGGVDVVTGNPVLDDFYPADLSGGNPYDYQRVAVLPAAQHLDGIHALEYVRSRHGDLREDFGRSERQQQVLVALRAKTKTLSATNLPDIAAALGNQLTTDMGIGQVADLLPIAGGIPSESIKHVLLLPPYTSGAQVGDQDVVMPNWSLILPLVAQTFPA
ncbi:MAG TPA: LCP family protein [Candidatus Dormibacteraeota bacterium]|nr:LCP family protein [Candidatus Dormibacteraeota bacterium]